MHSFTEENYIKAIFKLSEFNDGAISTNDIAARVHTKAATVTDMLKKLADKKLISYEKYKGVSLTTSGRKVALKIIRKHRLWEYFLVEKLKFSWDEVHDIAEQLEHIQSEELTEKLDDFLGHPKFDPHGDPIPDKHGKLANVDFKPLSEVNSKGKYIFKGVINHSKEFLQYISKLELSLGDSIQVKELMAFDKSVLIRYKQKEIFLSESVAKNLLVEKE